MSSLFDVIPGIQLNTNEILEAELFAQQILQSKYPDLDLREGTAVRDLVIRPTATLLATINKGMAYYFAQNTIAGITDDSPSDFLDSLMSNWFMTRKEGSNAVINARLFFARQKSVSLSSSSFFSTDNTLKFYPAASISIPSTALSFDAYSGEYYLDVDLVAETAGTNFNISSGSLLYFTNFDPYFLRAEINYLSQAANDRETNSEFITRASTAISTRNLVNVPSVISNLRESFSTITDISPIGFGDKEMIRDMVSVLVPGMATPVLIHNGGMVDVYCNTALASTVVQLRMDSNGKALVTGPIYSIARSEVSASADPDTVLINAAFTVTNPNTVSAVLTSLTTTDTTATGTLVNHGFPEGRYITISGAYEPAYNGSFLVTSVTKDTFTFIVPAGTPATATGTIIVTVVNPTQDVGFSDRQTLIIDMGIENADGLASFTLKYYDYLGGIQAYLEHPDNRVLCADLLARGYNTYLLDITVTAYNGPSPNPVICSDTIKAYLAGLEPGAPFIMADLLSMLYAAGITTIKTPLDITYSRYTRDLLPATTGVIVDFLDPKDRTSIFELNSVTTSNQSV